MNVDNLIRQFDRVNLELVPTRRPIVGTGNQDIFQMDIRKKAKASGEVFLVWPGAESNLAMVQAADKKLEQVVLFVKEEERHFWERVPLPWRQDEKLTEAQVRERHPNLGRRPLVLNDGAWWVSRKTPAENRHFLVGRDERQLFMCRLPGSPTSVMEAHKILKNPNLENLERKGEGKTVRQGEWFFVPLSEAEFWEIEKLAKAKTDLVHRRVGINRFIPRTGKPHMADELISTTPVGVSDPRIYVRGGVRHPDHKTVFFYKWHRVLRNNEAVASTGSVSLFGGRWID